MAKIINELIDKLDREEITNLQCITMHGQEMVNNYKEWCQVLGFQEGDEDGAEQFVSELRYGDEPDDGDLPEEVWDKIGGFFNGSSKDTNMHHNTVQNKGNGFSSMDLYNKWKEDNNLLTTLKNSDEAVKITLWRYLHVDGGIKTCARSINVSKNTVKKWWNIRYFIDATLADGGHVHPIRLDYDTIKKTIIQAVDKAEQG